MALRPEEADRRIANDGPAETKTANRGATAGTAGATAGAAVKRKSLARRIVPATLLLAAVAGAGLAAERWWTTGRFTETTNDAYVQADITVLAAKVSGYLSAVEAQNFQQVRAGDALAHIDDGDYRLALEAAVNKIATQNAAVARIDKQIAAARAAVTQAEAQRDSAQAETVRAEADFLRQQQLSKSDFSSRAQVDETRAARDRATAALRSAEAGTAQARANVDVLSAQREEAVRTLAETETQKRKAERDLSFTVIRAPFDGVIGNKAVEVGSYVDAGKRLMALVRAGTVHVDANFKETQVGRMRPGQTVHVKVDAFPDRDFVGRVVNLSPASGAVFSLLPPDNATGNFTKIVQRVPVRIELSAAVAAEGLLRPGMSAEASVDVRPPSGAVLAPGAGAADRAGASW